MKKRLLAICAVCSIYSSYSMSQSLDRIAAVVNNNIITQKELLNNAQAIEKQLASIGKPLNISRENFLKEVLERLITDKVLIQRARDVGLTLNEAEFNNIVAATAKQNNMTLESYITTIEKAGVNLKQWKQDQINNILLGRLRQKEVEPLVKVSESEIDSYLSALTGVTVAPLEKFDISRIYLPNNGGLDKQTLDKSREKAQNALDSINNGSLTFEQAQKYYSESSNKNPRVVLSDLGQLPSEISDVLLRMKREQIWPNLLETKEGFYILKLNDRIIDTGSREKAIQIPQTRVRQILLRVAGTTSEKDAKERLSQIKKRIDAGEDFGSLATLYSQDGSAMNGGNMSWVSLGEMVPEFEQAMNILNINQVSNPVRTDYGYHLIQVLERRIKSVGIGQQREAAKKVLTERKTEIIYQDWVRNLRERAFVEYKIK